MEPTGEPTPGPPLASIRKVDVHEGPGHGSIEARRHRGALAARQVWLFSSGPVGEPAKPDGDPVDVAELIEATGAVAHVVFSGRLDRSLLSIGERAMVMALRAPSGDFRDWDSIRSWGEEIAEELRSGEPMVAPRV